MLPLVWAGLLVAVLSTLRTSPSRLGRLFRYAQAIRFWAMPDVLVIAGFVIDMRTSQRLTTHIQPAGWCLFSTGVLALLMARVVAPHSTWYMIAPDHSLSAGESTGGLPGLWTGRPLEHDRAARSPVRPPHPPAEQGP